jgi:hypothetical protein
MVTEKSNVKPSISSCSFQESVCDGCWSSAAAAIAVFCGYILQSHLPASCEILLASSSPQYGPSLVYQILHEAVEHKKNSVLQL